jgi:glycosyltransferase involved in cell wall biosynthesis
MLNELRHSSFDVVHGHSYAAFPMLFASYAKSKFVVTAHYHGHGSTLFRDMLTGFYKPIGRKALHKADVVTAVSQYEKGLLRRDFGVDAVVIPSGIDLKRFKGLTKQSQGSILYVGRLEKYKGVQYIIQALRLVDPHIRLDIVGRGSYEAELMAMAEKLGDRRVALHQGLSDDEVLLRYARADLFILLSKYEAFGTVVAEALAAKVPCIVANTSALKEWVDNKNCFGIDYPFEHLPDLITQVIGKEVGNVKIWDWDDITAETLRIYQ